MTFEELTKRLKYLKPEDLNKVKLAYDFAAKAHQGQKRNTGEPYISHANAVAKTLAEWKLDVNAICAGLLHDVPEDTNYHLHDIRKNFGKEVAGLVDSVTKLGKVRIKKSWFPFTRKKKEAFTDFDRQVETLRKMILATSRDIRVVLIKLADRLHNMRTIHGVCKEKQERIAKETIEIYAPIASRLGMGNLKGELEDLAFPCLYPKECAWLSKLAVPELKKREKYLKRIKKILENKLQQANINIIDIHGRAKHKYSLYQKLLRHDKDFSKIYDLIAVRIVVPRIEDCYKVLGLIHTEWKPLIGRIKDYIAMPKPNGYQSLHTTVFCEDGEIVEFQIRTPQMHEMAEHGIVAHWHYSENKTSTKIPKSKLSWLLRLARWQKSLSNPKKLYEDLKLDFFQNRIFVYTPRGDVIDLPTGATPIDFAYAVHTDIGNHIKGARVNNKMVALSTPLKNYDIIEIQTARNQNPKQDWLKFVKTSQAKYSIKKYLKSDPTLLKIGRGLGKIVAVRPFTKKRKKHDTK